MFFILFQLYLAVVLSGLGLFLHFGHDECLTHLLGLKRLFVGGESCCCATRIKLSEAARSHLIQLVVG